MKVDSIDQYLKTLHQFHQEIENEQTNLSVTEKISQFLDDNQEYLTGNIEVATELNSIALVIKNSSVDDSLIKKIRGCVRQILPDEAQSRNHTLDMLRSNGGGIRQIAEWIDLADIPVDELPLTVEEQFGILGSKLDEPFIAPYLDGASLGKITEELLKHKKQWNDNEKKIVIALAKCCAQQDAVTIVENIKKFGVQDQSALAEIAKLCAWKDGEVTSYFIKNFGIQAQKDLVEIAKLCAQQHGYGTAYEIKNFGVQNPDALVEIAKLCAQQNGEGTAVNIKNFGVQNPDALVEIAKLCAQQNGKGTAENIQNFGVQNPGALVEIAKLCARQNGEGTALNIKNFGVQNPDALVEIAKLCARQNGEGTAANIKNFNIKDGQDRFRIFLECAKQSEAALPFAKNFVPFPELFHNVFECISIFASNEEAHQGRRALFEALHKTIQGLQCSEAHKVELQTLGNKILELDSFQYSIQILWFLRCLALMTTLDQKAVEWTLEKGLLSDLSELRDPNLRQQLSVGLFALVESEEGRNRWNEFLSQMSPKKGLRLLAIPLFNLEKAGIPSEDISKVLEKALTKNIKNDALKIQRLLRTTHLLASTSILKEEQKAFAFRKIFLEVVNEAQILDNSKAVIGLLQLKDTDWPDAQNDVRSLFRACFEKIIPLEGFKGDASQMYDKYFANSRHPGGLITYAAGLKTLNETDLLKCLGRFVVSVFDGTFKSQRYDSEQNPHLTKIYEARPDLKEKWSQCREMRFENVSRDGIFQKEVFDAKEWLTSNLCRFGHLGEEDLSIVRAYLDANSDESRKAVQKSLSEALRKCSVGKKKADLDRDPRVLNLKIQLSCIKLAIEGNERPLGALQKEFKAINQSLEAKGVRGEFANDVNAILAVIEQPNAPIKETFQAVITDDPLDLLYVGMDVQGSCQRLDGPPYLNKGLLGYLMDGKNQVLAIKDPNGKIAARAMLRLMWDGERPVLYRECFYPSTISQQEKEAMNEVAIQLAEALDVPMTAEDGEVNYEKPLHSLGGPAPWEYSDGSGGLQRNGVYTITSAKLLTE